VNYLAHLYLAGAPGAFRVGNLAGDFLRGRVENSGLSPAMQAGVRLHRHIDSFSNRHTAVVRSRRRFSGDRRRVAGIIVDMAYDHLLCRHWSRFSDQPLGSFIDETYHELARHHDALPPRLARVAPRIRQQDWLGSYRDLAGIGLALDRMAMRLSRPETLAGAVADLRAAYDGLERDFLAFFPDAVKCATHWRHEHAIMVRSGDS